jgi:hypothetical protein
LSYLEETWDMSDSRAKPRVPVAPPADEGATISTVRPPFDPLEFARDSESKMRIVDAELPSNRPTAPPPPGLPQYQAGLTSGTMASLASVGLDTVPALAVARDDLAWFALPEPAAKLVAQVDGHDDIGTLAVRSGVPLDAAMAAFHELARQGIVTLRR